MAYRPTKEALKDSVDDALGLGLDVHSSFTWLSYLSDGLDEHFIARYMELIGTARFEFLTDPSSFWTLESQQTVPPLDGSFLCSSERLLVVAISKQSWDYGWAVFRTKLPAFSIDTQCMWLGLGNSGNGRTGFYYRREAGGVLTLYVNVTSLFFSPSQFVNISNFLPANATTALHTYSVYNSRSKVEFYIDGILRAVCVNSPGQAFTAIPGPPYALFRSNPTAATRLRGLIALIGQGTELVLPLNPQGVRFCHGDPVPPRVYRLYEAGTQNLLAGSSVDPNMTSHPFPLFGYDGKTINFMSDEAGNLDIEVLKQTDNWRVHSTTAVVANTLLTITIADEEVLGRIVFRPNIPPANILEAEVVLR